MSDPAPPASDAANVDRFLDEQATGPDIYDPTYIPPARPRWRALIEPEEAP